MRTLALAMKSQDNNLTLLRLVAALAVMYYHCYPLALGRKAHDPISAWLLESVNIGLGGLAVGLFFAVSGFLVTASYANRDSLFAFVEARALRIFPGLLVAVLFCVLLVGPLVTKLQLDDYFSNDRTWRFLATNTALIFGVQYRLPGVFEDNPFDYAVNGSLWSLPVEVWMYSWVAIVGALGVLKERSVFNGVFIIGLLVYLAAPENFPITQVDGSIRNPLFFLIGSFFYVNRRYIPLNLPVLLVISLVMLTWKHFGRIETIPMTIYIAYLIFFVAYFPPLVVLPAGRFDDISFGVYIYAFPVQQMIAHYITGVSPIGMFAVALLVTLALALASWRIVEQPALRLKGRMPMGRRFLDPRASGL